MVTDAEHKNHKIDFKMTLALTIFSMTDYHLRELFYTNILNNKPAEQFFCVAMVTVIF